MKIFTDKNFFSRTLFSFFSRAVDYFHGHFYDFFHGKKKIFHGEKKKHWIDGFLKDLYQKTTFALKMWSKTHIWKNLRILCEIDQNVSIFVEKLKKMQTPKMTFRSQIEPSIKSYECFMFLQNFRVEITLDWWILERA